jgi:hypothetical protein
MMEIGDAFEVDDVAEALCQQGGGVFEVVSKDGQFFRAVCEGGAVTSLKNIGGRMAVVPQHKDWLVRKIGD